MGMIAVRRERRRARAVDVKRQRHADSVPAADDARAEVPTTKAG
jgi:hypothetical protein